MVNGHNASQAYKKAYPGCKSGARQAASLLLTNINIKAEITRRIDKKNEVIDLSREAQYRRLLDIAQDPTTPKTVVVSALRELNNVLGYQRELAPNLDKEQAILQRMTAEELKTAEAIARLRTMSESMPKLATG